MYRGGSASPRSVYAYTPLMCPPVSTTLSPDRGKDGFANRVVVEPPLFPTVDNGWCVSSSVRNQSTSSGCIRDTSDMTPSVVTVLTQQDKIDCEQKMHMMQLQAANITLTNHPRSVFCHSNVN